MAALCRSLIAASAMFNSMISPAIWPPVMPGKPNPARIPPDGAGPLSSAAAGMTVLTAGECAGLDVGSTTDLDHLLAARWLGAGAGTAGRRRRTVRGGKPATATEGRLLGGPTRRFR